MSVLETTYFGIAFIFLPNPFVAHRGPRLGEALVGDAPEQLRVSGHQLVELELVALLAAVELERPAAVLVLLAAARILDHTVQA